VPPLSWLDPTADLYITQISQEAISNVSLTTLDAIVVCQLGFVAQANGRYSESDNDWYLVSILPFTVSLLAIPYGRISF
jgi:hypothetical protein